MALARDLLKFSKLSNLADFSEISNGGSLKKFPFITSVRTGKHYNPKFKWLRQKKYAPIVLPHTEKYRERNAEHIKNLGIFPRYWKPRPLTITSAGEVFDPYQPILGDGKVSKLKGAKDLVTEPKNKIVEMTAMRKIKNYESDFTPELFVQEAQDIYVKAHTVLMKNSAEELSQYVTERAIEEMLHGLKNTTLRWNFIKSLEPPRIVQSRVHELVTKSNLFAQITVRFHTQQTLALYDRFGRLMYGNEFLAKDVLEYVVFEKHINNDYGVWRLHAKIIPEWREADEKPARTYRVEAEKEEEEDEDEDLEDFSKNFSYPEVPEVVKEPEDKLSK